MMRIARNWRVLLAALAVIVGGAMGFPAATASAEPVFPPRPNPVPAPAAPLTPPTAPGPVGNSMPGTAPSLPPNGGTSPVAPARPAAPTLPAPTLAPASSGTLSDYLHTKNVQLEPQQPQNFKPLDISLPLPPRWTQVPDPNVPDAFAVIADRTGNSSLYTSNAQVVVYKLIGDFDPREAITHGYVDSQQSPAWRTTNASMADSGGFPASLIEGTYRQSDMTLNTSRRHIIATSGTNRYLVSLAVTTAVSQAVADGPATDAIINGFRVSTPGATPSVAAPAPGPSTPPLSGLSPTPSR
ncbi:LpqN/LpqT family lipoprotein [Mycobacterium sp.]|uniref:LpqN/LpqT family lipoprotein n=1 Tax=Mycobacterium sp. TaxID=1785 RepID=UPI003D6AFED3